MLKNLLIFILSLLFKLRYQIIVKNLDIISSKGTRGILFLPNHPALIDPAIINSILCRKFSPRALADQKQLNLPFINHFLKLFKPITLPDLKESQSVGNKEIVVKQLSLVAEILKNQGNVLLYPSGRVYRGRYEDLRSNSSVESILKNSPEVRLVLIRITGLWGSSLSWGYSDYPSLFKFTTKYLLVLAANLVFFIPKRKIEIEFYEPADFPRNNDRNTQNRFMEQFYNKIAPANTLVSYYFFQTPKARIIPEPQLRNSSLDLSSVSAKTSGRVLEKLSEFTGIKIIKPSDNLAKDLGLDSLALVDLSTWIESEFGYSQESMEHLQSVGDLILAACGDIANLGKNQFKDVDPKWFLDQNKTDLIAFEEKTIAEAFLHQAISAPKQILLADQLAGVKSNRDILTAVFILKKVIEKYHGEKIGIMLPATVTATITYLATLFSGKTPVMVNWTVGESILKYSLRLVGTNKVLTSKKLIEKLQKQGNDYADCGIEWLYLEDIGAKLTIFDKLTGAFKSHFMPKLLTKAKVLDIAAILFTSGSEAKPKAVPLSHKNFLSNIQDYLSTIKLTKDNRLIGILPPFHSFGLSCSVILPLITGAKIVYHANPTEGAILGELISLYKVSVLFGTPTFVNGILRTTPSEKLASIRLLVTGAEKCPESVYQKIADSCPLAVMSEGYGITECSPVVSLNDLKNPVKGTIGKILPGIEYKILHHETGAEVKSDEQGILILRGASIFDGYLNYSGKTAFINYNGFTWYNTGDLVQENDEKVITFRGRLKRFVKIGGEMISLAVVEEVLAQSYPPDENGSLIAVEADFPDENPELVLFTTQLVEREHINKLLRQGGLSGLYNIRRIIRVEIIPLLGSGKTDYQSLKELLKTQK